MPDIKSKILQFGGKQKSTEMFTTIKVRKKDVVKIRQTLKDMGLSMTLTDAFTFAVNNTFGGK
jgi:hypothetical protein